MRVIKFLALLSVIVFVGRVSVNPQDLNAKTPAPPAVANNATPSNATVAIASSMPTEAAGNSSWIASVKVFSFEEWQGTLVREIVGWR